MGLQRGFQQHKSLICERIECSFVSWCLSWWYFVDELSQNGKCPWSDISRVSLATLTVHDAQMYSVSRVSPEHSTVAWGSAKQFVFPALGTLSLIWNMEWRLYMTYLCCTMYTCCTVQYTHLEHEGDMTSPTETGLPIRREHVRQAGLTCLLPRQS